MLNVFSASNKVARNHPIITVLATLFAFVFGVLYVSDRTQKHIQHIEHVQRMENLRDVLADTE